MDALIDLFTLYSLVLHKYTHTRKRDKRVPQTILLADALELNNKALLHIRT
jgi:hypothetical protein